MCKLVASQAELQELEMRIDELRNALNQMCCTIDRELHSANVVSLSQNLDELIVKYMKVTR